MVVQAQAADALVDRDPERARSAMQAVGTAGREALVELRALLGMLHQDPSGETDGRPAEPQPGLGDVRALVDSAREAGLPVTLQLTEAAPVPAMVGAATYRIVQEALTNVVKHGRGARADVTVAVGQDVVEVAVCDDGPGPGAGSPTGYGLAGMRERAAFVGGTVVARARERGGFEVRARLPLTGRDR